MNENLLQFLHYSENMLYLACDSSICRAFLGKLKLIKNFTRNTKTEERRTDLAVLSIENELARAVDLEDISMILQT